MTPPARTAASSLIDGLNPVPCAGKREVVFLVEPQNLKVVGVTTGIQKLLGFETVDIVGSEFTSLYAATEAMPAPHWNSGETVRLSFFCADHTQRQFDVTFAPMASDERRHMKMAVLHVPPCDQALDDPHAHHLVETEALRTILKKGHSPANPINEQFFSKISHQIRTPLSIILSSAGILGRYHHNLTGEQRQEYIEAISTSVQRISGLLEDFVWIGKLQTGGTPCHLRTEDLPTLCLHIIEEARAARSDQSVPITFHHDGCCGHAQCDETLLRLMLGHLLGNALKFTRGSQAVRLDVKREDALCHFFIADNGPGISENDRSHLFEPFYRGGNVGEVPGNGLGLAIAQRCAVLHGGSITMESRPGEGTTFHVVLPLFRGQPQATAGLEKENHPH